MVTERFCSQCGFSLVPLEGTHLSAACSDCSRKRYFVRVGDDGKGIKLEAGESITVALPPLSLKPGGGTFFRPGLSWYLRLIAFPPQLRPLSIELDEIFDTLERQFDEIHRNSRFLSDLGIDYDNPPKNYDFESYSKAIKNDESLPELWAFNGSLLVGIARDEMKNGNHEQAMKALHNATRCASVLNLYGDVEETIWRGYLWEVQRCEANSASIGDPAKIEALEILSRRLEELSPVALHDLLNSENVGEKLKVSNLTDTEIKNVVSYVWDRKETAKSEAKEERKLKFDAKSLWVNAVVAIISAILGALLS